MGTFLVRVDAVQVDSQGLRLTPGIRLSQTRDPRIRQMMQGAQLELRRPDGTRSRTTLVTYGVSAWRGEDGALYLCGDPADPPIELTISSNVPVEQIPTGTEVWLL